MISCFKGGASNFWRNSYENTQGAVYTSSAVHTDGVPRISKIIESLKQYDVFKYSAYRTAFKLRTIQKASKLHMVDLSVISSILKDYECSNQSVEEPITSSKAENLLCALYIEAGKKIGFTEEPNLMALLFLAFLQNTFVEAEKPLLFIHVKIALTLFSAAKLSEKYKYLFYHCSGGTSISKENLELLLKSLSKMAEIVGEQVTFGSHLVSAAVKHCLKFCKGRITEKKFHKWLSLEPQTTVWISTLHRISASEKIQHIVTCSHCQENPIIGLRYRCLQCINYNLCQNCFLCGQMNQGHKERHPVQEFCLPASVWEETKATMNAIKNKIPFARCPAKPYLSFDDESLYESFRDPSKNISVKTVQNHSMKMTTNADLIKELSSIINKLEEEKKQISAVVGLYNENMEHNAEQKSSEVHEQKRSLPTQASLCELNSNLEAQLGRLKTLLENLKKSTSVKKEIGISPVPHAPFSKMDHYFESTPVNSATCPVQTEDKPKVYIDNSDDATEKQRACDTSLDFSNAMHTNSLSKNTEFLSSGSNSYFKENHSTSFDLSNAWNSSDSLNLSAKIAELGSESKLNPIYLYSESEWNESLNRRVAEHSCFVSPIKNSAHFFVGNSSESNRKSTFTVNKDGSLEKLELELNAIMLQIEDLLPQVSSIANDSQFEKEKVLTALSEVEGAVKKLSHVSIELSTGSTDL